MDSPEAGAAAGARMTAQLGSAKDLHTVLSCLLEVDNQTKSREKRQCLVKCELTNDQLTFCVNGRAKSTQITGVLPTELFESFECVLPGDDAAATFCLSLKTLVDCLAIFGLPSLSSTSCTLSFLERDQVRVSPRLLGSSRSPHLPP